MMRETVEYCRIHQISSGDQICSHCGVFMYYRVVTFKVKKKIQGNLTTPVGSFWIFIIK